MATSNYLRSAADEAEALEQLHEDQCTDGLPVIIPTPERVERMVVAGGLDEDLVVGVMGPQNGAATVLHIAINAVMAGCKPDYFPVVLAAIRAVCQPEFDLGEMQCTTHATAPLIIINGPAREACELASGSGLMGPGYRANASIGRALRLAMINVGGARPGVSDMALHGHPGKFTYCIAEAEESSPFPPLHVAAETRFATLELRFVTPRGLRYPSGGAPNLGLSLPTPSPVPPLLRWPRRAHVPPRPCGIRQRDRQLRLSIAPLDGELGGPAPRAKNPSQPRRSRATLLEFAAHFRFAPARPHRIGVMKRPRGTHHPLRARPLLRRSSFLRPR